MKEHKTWAPDFRLSETTILMRQLGTTAHQPFKNLQFIIADGRIGDPFTCRSPMATAVRRIGWRRAGTRASLSLAAGAGGGGETQKAGTHSK